jgi:hypothetical protein
MDFDFAVKRVERGESFDGVAMCSGDFCIVSPMNAIETSWA